MKELEKKELKANKNNIYIDGKSIEEYADEIINFVIENNVKPMAPCTYKEVTTLEMPGNSMVNHPRHYNKGKYECLEVVKELIKDMNGVEGALFFNVFKYLWRYPDKNGIEDLKKCEFYLKDLIAFNENI